MSFWSKTVEILNPFTALANEDITTLIRLKNVERINELIKQGKICDFDRLARDIYFWNDSYELLNELDIDSSDLCKIMKNLEFYRKVEFIKQVTNVTNINFEDLYQDALKSNDIEFISKVTVIGLTHYEASFNHVFNLAKHVIAREDAEDIYNFANSVLSSAINHYAKADYLELVETLENAIIETKDTNYIAKFAQDIEGADNEKLIKAVINAKKDNSNKESNNSKEENDATREIINLAIKSNAIYIETIIAQIINTNNTDLIINLAYCLILNNVDKDFIIDFVARLKEIKNTECMYRIINELTNLPNKELGDLLTNELIQSIIDLEDLKHCILLTWKHQTISLENLYKLFGVIRKAFKIEDNTSIKSVGEILANFVELKMLDETSLACYISYLNFKETGTLLPPVNSPDGLGEKIIVGGRQYQLVKPDENNQIKGA